MNHSTRYVVAQWLLLSWFTFEAYGAGRTAFYYMSDKIFHSFYAVAD